MKSRTYSAMLTCDAPDCAASVVLLMWAAKSDDVLIPVDSGAMPDGWRERRVGCLTQHACSLECERKLLVYAEAREVEG